MNAPAPDVSWSLTWEDDATPDEHAELAALFGRCFPRSRTSFTGVRSWSSGQPELRIIGRADAVVVAHLGILRRFLQHDGRAQDAAPAGITAPPPVHGARGARGDVGLVATDPAVQGHGACAPMTRWPSGVRVDDDLIFGDDRIEY